MEAAVRRDLARTLDAAFAARAHGANPEAAADAFLAALDVAALSVFSLA